MTCLLQLPLLACNESGVLDVDLRSLLLHGSQLRPAAVRIQQTAPPDGSCIAIGNVHVLDEEVLRVAWTLVLCEEFPCPSRGDES